MTRPRVALVVTGRLEFRGLPRALGRLFPGADFVVAPGLDEFELVDSTSTRVDPARNARNASAGERPTIDDLVDLLAGAVCGRDAADFAVLVEDLELENRTNEAAVIQGVHEAVERHIVTTSQRPHAPRDLAARLEARASFHLLDPMVEVYFYDDAATLSRAQGSLGRAAHREADRDVERFKANASADSQYFAEVGECARHRRPKDRKCPWRGPSRDEHPKKYLKYLCREEAPNEFCSSYQETDGGVAALASLDWNSVLSGPGTAPYLRALVEDLEEALGLTPALRAWPTAPTSTALTARSRATRDRVLRNL